MIDVGDSGRRVDGRIEPADLVNVAGRCPGPWVTVVPVGRLTKDDVGALSVIRDLDPTILRLCRRESADRTESD